jgi:hypothetical protein
MLAAVPYYTPGSFDLKAINELTAQAVGYSVFGYWETFLSETKLLKEHVGLSDLSLHHDLHS